MERADYQTYKSLLEKMTIMFKRHYQDDLVCCALFGSVARGEARPESDIDILIILAKGLSDPMQKFLNFLEEFRQDEEYQQLRHKGFFPEPYPIILTQKELEVDPLILLDIFDHGIILWDKGGYLKEKLRKLKEKLDLLGAQRKVLPDGTWYWDLKPDWKPKEVIEI
jgi:predicted nucleotidyltransferase